MKETYKNYQILITLYMKETITFSKKKKKNYSILHNKIRER